MIPSFPESLPRTALVTGSNRGIGLEFTSQLLHLGWRVFAVCRKKNEPLLLLETKFPNSLHCLTAEITSQREKISATLHDANSPLDLLINNAGAFEPEEGISSLTAEGMLRIYHLNAITPLLLAQALLPSLKKSPHAIIANLVSGSGIFEKKNGSPNHQYSYAGSKAALNLYTVFLADDLRPDGITVIGLNPGFVKTDMTRDSPVRPPLEPRDSVAGMLKILTSASVEQSGSFFSWDGSPCF